MSSALKAVLAEETDGRTDGRKSRIDSIHDLGSTSLIRDLTSNVPDIVMFNEAMDAHIGSTENEIMKS